MAIIIVAVAIIISFSAKSRVNNALDNAPIGKKLPIASLNFSLNDRNVVLLLQRDCHFCTESASFYRELISRKSKSNGISVIAVLPQANEEARLYLGSLNIKPDSTIQHPLQSLWVKGTPTLVILNRDGVVTHWWRGKLEQSQESEVFKALGLLE